MKQSVTQPVTPTATAPANGHQTLSAYIRARFDEFSRSQKDVAQYIVDHLDEAAFQTAEELALRASTSSSTVVRFSQALGFEGFPELQQAARDEYRRRPPGLSGGAPQDRSTDPCCLHGSRTHLRYPSGATLIWSLWSIDLSISKREFSFRNA